MLGDSESLAGLERGIRDLAGRVLANPDVQQLGDSIRTGALKVSFWGSFFCWVWGNEADWNREL